MPRSFGQTVSTTAVTEVPLAGTTYTEQTSGAQRALKSSSAADAAAGTGARKVKVTYYTLASDGTVTGPFVEVVTLNGVTAVPMVATNLALLESMEVVSVGSGGVPAGTLTLTVDAAGVGAAIATVAAGAMRAQLAHHYVPTGFMCEILDVLVTGGDPAAGKFSVKALPYPSLGAEKEVSGPVFNSNTKPEQALLRGAFVKGPCRVRLYVAPANTNAQVSYGSFGYTDRRTAAF